MDASHKAPEPPACIAQGTENRCEAVHIGWHRDRCTRRSLRGIWCDGRRSERRL